MNEHEHERLRTDLGAYLLGGLPAEDAARIEAHLAECHECRAEADALRPTAGALALLREPAVRPVDSPPADLGDRVLGAVAAERAPSSPEPDVRWSGRARPAVLAVIAGAAAAVVLVAGIVVARPDPAPDVAAPVVPTEPVSVTVEEAGLSADADLVNHTWGVEVKLTGTGFHDGERYRVSVLGTDGRRYSAGQFVGVGAVEMHCNLNSAVLREDASGFEVVDRSGDVVLISTFA